jgi:uncharacterized sulfatase
MQDVLMLPELFRKNGYYTAQTGKIFHTGPEHEDPRSWDYMLPESGKSPPPLEVLQSHKAPEPRNHSMAWLKLRTPDEQTPDGMVARKAAELMKRSVNEKKPFFWGLAFAVLTPRMPLPRNTSTCTTRRSSHFPPRATGTPYLPLRSTSARISRS